MTINKLTSAALFSLFLIILSWSPASGAAPKITKVQVTESTMASQVEILADAPVTYTYYTLATPSRAIIDVALADSAQISRRIKVESPLITGITLDRLDMPPVPLTRITISLSHDAYLSVRSTPEDKGRLLVTLVKKMVSAPEPEVKDDVEKDLEEAGKKAGGQSEAVLKPTPREKELDDLTEEKETGGKATAEKAATPVTQSAPAPPPAPAVSAPVAALSAESPKSTVAPAAKSKSASLQNPKIDLRPVVPTIEEPKTTPPMTVTATGVIFSGFTPTKTPRVFRLSGPNRLVIDIPGNKGVTRQTELPLNRFGIKKVRIGEYPSKVRFVFDAGQSPLPAYRIESAQSGLKVTFSK